MMQPSGMAQRRSFLVLEEGELDGTSGYWAEDEDDGAGGFLASSMMMLITQVSKKVPR